MKLAGFDQLLSNNTAMSIIPTSQGKEPLEDVELRTSPPDNGIAQHETKTRIPFFRSTLFQILVVGSCAFCAPGVSDIATRLRIVTILKLSHRYGTL